MPVSSYRPGPDPEQNSLVDVNGGVAGAPGRFEITIRIARVVVRVRVRVTMIEEEFDRFNWNSEAEPFAESNLHVRNSNYLATHVEQRAATVTGIDLCGRLQI